MSSAWFMVALAILQAAATGALMWEGKLSLGAVYACYSLSNVFLIYVARGQA